jgi:hypothetical protein
MTESSERMVETDTSTAAPRSKSFPKWKHVFGLVFALIAGIAGHSARHLLCPAD